MLVVAWSRSIMLSQNDSVCAIDSSAGSAARRRHRAAGTVYEQVVSPAFRPASGIVYILPETRTPRETFGSYDVDEHARQQPALDVATLRLEGKAPGGRIIRLRRRRSGPRIAEWMAPMSRAVHIGE